MKQQHLQLTETERTALEALLPFAHQPVRVLKRVLALILIWRGARSLKLIRYRLCPQRQPVLTVPPLPKGIRT